MDSIISTLTSVFSEGTPVNEVNRDSTVVIGKQDL